METNTFKNLSQKARISAQNDRKAAKAVSDPTIPSVERVARAPTSSSKAIENRLDDIECALKKLELNLNLVDGDTEDATEFEDLKKDILLKCKNNKNTDDLTNFISSMESKRNNNRLKGIVNWLSFICSLIPIINQTSLPQIISKRFTSEDIGSAYNIFQNYMIMLGEIFKAALEGLSSNNENIDRFDKAFEVDFFPTPLTNVTAKITRVPGTLISSISSIPSIIQKIYKLSTPLQITAISGGKEFSKKLCKNYNRLLQIFLLSMFIYILLNSKIRLRQDKTPHNITDMSNIADMFNTSRFIEISGGKKATKGKKAKKPTKSVR